MRGSLLRKDKQGVQAEILGIEMKPAQTINKLTDGMLVTIAAIGDSLTYGWMARKGYLDFFRDMLGEKYPKAKINIINSGIPGDTAEGGLQRVHEHVINYDPDMVFIQFGLNDAFTGESPERYKNNIRAIIENIDENTGSDILLVTSVCLDNSRENEMANNFYQKLEELSQEYKLPIARVHEYWRTRIGEGVEFRKLVQADMVHPTVLGYQLMAEAIMQVFDT